MRCLRVIVPVRQGTTIQILPAVAHERKHNLPDTSRTGTWKKAQPSKYFTQRQVKESTLPRYFTHRHAKESKTTHILQAQARERKHNHPDTSRTGTWKKAKPSRYFTHRHVKESTTTQILPAQARERKHKHPDTSRTGKWKKAHYPDTPRTGTWRKAQPLRYFTHRHVKESTTTQILHAQARERKHNYPDTSGMVTLQATTTQIFNKIGRRVGW